MKTSTKLRNRILAILMCLMLLVPSFTWVFAEEDLPALSARVNKVEIETSFNARFGGIWRPMNSQAPKATKWANGSKITSGPISFERISEHELL